MKKTIASIVLFCVLFCASCDKNTDTALSELSRPASSDSSAISSSQQNEPSAAKIYSFSEIDASFGPSAASVDDLSQLFGTPNNVYGYLLSASSLSYAIVAEFDGITFEFVANNGEKLSFASGDETDAGEKFNVTENDKKVKMKPCSTSVNSAKLSLTRGIKTGCVRADVTAAYGGDTGKELYLDGDGILWINYTYRPDKIIEYTSDYEFNVDSQTGGVYYCFDDNDVLVSTAVAWYNGYLAFD